VFGVHIIKVLPGCFHCEGLQLACSSLYKGWLYDETTPSVRQMVLVPTLVIIVLTCLISSLFHLPLSDNNRRQSNYSFIMKITRIALVIVPMYGLSDYYHTCLL
jgi:hypothetical protein